MTEQEIEDEVEKRVVARLEAAIATVTEGFSFVYESNGMSLGVNSSSHRQSYSRTINKPQIMLLRELGVLLDAVRQVSTKNVYSVAKQTSENRDEFKKAVRARLKLKTKGRIPVSQLDSIISVLTEIFDRFTATKVTAVSLPFDPDMWAADVIHSQKMKEDYEHFHRSFKQFIEMDRHGNVATVEPDLFGMDVARPLTQADEYRNLVMSSMPMEDAGISPQAISASELRLNHLDRREAFIEHIEFGSRRRPRGPRFL